MLNHCPECTLLSSTQAKVVFWSVSQNSSSGSSVFSTISTGFDRQNSDWINEKQKKDPLLDPVFHEFRATL